MGDAGERLAVGDAGEGLGRVWLVQGWDWGWRREEAGCGWCRGGAGVWVMQGRGWHVGNAGVGLGAGGGVWLVQGGNEAKCVHDYRVSLKISTQFSHSFQGGLDFKSPIKIYRIIEGTPGKHEASMVASMTLCSSSGLRRVT